MEFTPIQNLPCLSDEDYAAYALYMQCLAEQIDGLLTEKNDALEVFRNRYAGMWRNTVAYVSAANSFDSQVETTTNLFWNDPNNPPSTGTSGSASDPFRFNFPGNVAGGLYAVGVTASFNQGATASSLREAYIETIFFGSTGVNQRISALDQTEETLSGGEHLQTGYHVPLTPQELATNVTATPGGFYVHVHETDAGNVTIPIGSLTFWVVFLGTNTPIGGS